MVRQDSNWLPLNIRLFHSRQTLGFFQELISINFNIRFAVNLVGANVSIFGYELYNLALGGLNMGSTSMFAENCKNMYGYVEGGSTWGVPSSNGTIVPIEQPNEWPPAYMLPQYESETYELGLDGLLDSLTKGISFGGVDSVLGTISIRLNLAVESPIPIPAWLYKLSTTLVIDMAHAENYSEGAVWVPQAYVEKDIMQELNVYAGYNGDPWDLRLNTLSEGSVNWPESIPVQSVAISVEWSMLSILVDNINLWMLLLGDGKIHFNCDVLWLQLQYLTVQLMFPSEFMYVLPIMVPSDMVTFDLVELLEGTVVKEGGVIF